jgi:hypothetical protein
MFFNLTIHFELKNYSNSKDMIKELERLFNQANQNFSYSVIK